MVRLLTLTESAMMNEINWFSVKEVAEQLGLNPQTVYRLIREGRLGCYKFARNVRIGKHHLDSYIRSAERSVEL